MASRKLLLEAARLMEEDARCAAEACEVNDRLWQCADCRAAGPKPCHAQLAHAERMRTITALKQAA